MMITIIKRLIARMVIVHEYTPRDHGFDFLHFHNFKSGLVPPSLVRTTG